MRNFKWAVLMLGTVIGGSLVIGCQKPCPEAKPDPAVTPMTQDDGSLNADTDTQDVRSPGSGS